MPKQKCPHGFYCKICSQHKANEKFSGKGHANHICKACSRLSPDSKVESQTINRLMNLPMRRLTDSEKKWLENRVHDSQPEVAELARVVYNMCFPHAQHNTIKKQLLINTLTFEVHCKIYDEYGDYIMVNQHFAADRKTSMLVFTDLNSNGQEQTITLEQDKMRKLLKWMVHSLEIFMWAQDYCGTSDPDNVELDYLDDEDEPGDFDLAQLVDSISIQVEYTNPIPVWKVHAEYSNHTVQDTSCYDGDILDKVEELYLKLLEYFQTDTDEFNEDDYDRHPKDEEAWHESGSFR